MHRDHWIPAVDRTKVFRLFGCSLKPIAYRLLRLFPHAYRLKPLACFREFDLARFRGGL